MKHKKHIRKHKKKKKKTQKKKKYNGLFGELKKLALIAKVI